MTDATPTQPTGSGKLIWRKPLTEDVIEFGTLPDPRDVRTAELEAALREIESEALRSTGTKWGKLAIIQDIASRALMPPPEGDMRETVEEWDA